VVWKTEIPGIGWSSPIVWGDNIFLTSVIKSGETETVKKGLYFGGERPASKTNIGGWFTRSILKPERSCGSARFSRACPRARGI
jgi:hypothetical protein